MGCRLKRFSVTLFCPFASLSISPYMPRECVFSACLQRAQREQRLAASGGQPRPPCAAGEPGRRQRYGGGATGGGPAGELRAHGGREPETTLLNCGHVNLPLGRLYENDDHIFAPKLPSEGLE